MNIVVKTLSGKYVVRPDTTWERDNEDLFPPQEATELTYAPVLFARISKPGRSVGERFADRYYDGVGYGVLLYPENFIDGSPEGFACASCLDHTSFLPFPVYNKATLGREDNRFALTIGDDEVFSCAAHDPKVIEKAIAEATKYIYIRIGDLIAIELDERKPLTTNVPGRTHVKGTYCDNWLMEFDVVY